MQLNPLFNFSNSFAELPDRFHEKLLPTKVSAPGLIAVNHDLAGELGLDAGFLESESGVAILAGNRVPQGAEPLAMAYAGHQFGNLVPQLGDGRALLLGEIVDRSGKRRDLQLKGSGRTPFSRQGDGRAWVGPIIREYLVSEAMHGLGIPTTRALAAVTTGEPVYRESPLPGAILARVSDSHVRIGTFEYFAIRRDVEALALLTSHVVSRLYPELAGTDRPALGLLEKVAARQATLVAAWMGAGFVHGVMNTDNVSLSGETIDYGPCAFMDHFNPTKVFSSIDHGGRYGYSNQLPICYWNLGRFAEALVPLIDDDRDRAIALANEVVLGYLQQAVDAWSETFCRKIGVAGKPRGCRLVNRFTELLDRNRVDFTEAFRRLSSLPLEPAGQEEFCNYLGGSGDVRSWLQDWTRESRKQKLPDAERTASMKLVNPAVIPRNHLVEQAIDLAVQGDYSLFSQLNAAWKDPFADRPPEDRLRRPPAPEEVVTRTFCGT